MPEFRRRFTLLEMAAVLVIAALISVLAVVMISPRAVPQRPAAGHAEKLGELLASARDAAAASGAAQLVFLAESPRRWVWRENDRELPVPRGVGISGRRIESEDADIDSAAAETAFRFSPGGVPEAAEARISDRTAAITVATSPLSCRILISPAESETPEPLWDSEREPR